MRKLIIIILGLFSVAYGQKYQSMPQAGYGPVKRMQFDSVVTLPMGITRLRNLSDGRDSGQIRYNPSDSSMYVYTGHTWVKCGRSELSALAPLYAYNDTTIAIDTTSSEGVATKWDLSQVSGGGGTDTALIRTIISDSINSYGTFLFDRTVNAATHRLTFDSILNLNITAQDFDGDGNGQINLNTYDFGALNQSTIQANGNSSSINTTNQGELKYSSVSTNANYVEIQSANNTSNTKQYIYPDSVVFKSPNLRITLPSAGANKVLTSDANGTATWQTPTATDTTSLSNRIDAKASLSGATFTSRVQLQGVNITKDSIPIVNNKQWVMFIDTATGRVSRQLDIDNEPIINAMQALGSTIKATTVGVDVSKIAAASAIANNTVYYMVTWIPNDTTLTGVSWFQTVQGVYTASGYNGVGLYSYSGGTWTLVASSTDDGNIWKATANTYPTKDFTTPYRAAKGVYAIACTWNRSAVTTAPTIGRGGVLTNAAVSSIGTNSAKLYSSSSGSSLPSTIAASSQSTFNTALFLALY